MNLVRLTMGSLWFAASIALAAPGDMVSTGARLIKDVQIQNADTGATYYFTAEGGWQVSNCAGVTLAYIPESYPGAKAILATVLAAKAAGTPISFYGICGDTAGNALYLQIRYTTG